MDSFILIENFTMAAGIIFLTTFQTDCNWEKKQKKKKQSKRLISMGTAHKFSDWL